MSDTGFDSSYTLQVAIEQSDKLSAAIAKTPEKFRMLTGDRPTGSLHIGHLFGSLQNRVKLQNLGMESFVVIADYQVLTDHDAFDKISQNVYELVMDYLSVGLDPEKHNTFIFPHSQIPELNQLILPFLTLVSNSELDKNPTVKEEILASGKKSVNAGMYIYPIHQACDILFCKSTVIPVGKDQLPHLEMTRTIAKRFNNKFNNNELFPMPTALLSESPLILGLDGEQKMSKSRGNSIMLKATAEETAKLIKKAKTDATREITYDPENRPEVSNLLRLASFATGNTPESIANEIGEKGSGELKRYLTESLNAYLAPIRQKRAELENEKGYLHDVLVRGVDRARSVAIDTLEEVREAMNMKI